MRFHNTLLALTVLIFSFGCSAESDETTPQETMRKIARNAGLDAFAKVESISYTFNADLGDRKFVRAWTWLPKTDEVILHGEAETEDIRYKRAEVPSDKTGQLEKTDQQFVNDLYWMIFPFQVVWDKSVSIEPLPEEAAGVFPDAYAGLRVRYPEGVGYTPGDVYDIFHDGNYRVTHWVFRQGGSAEPTRATEWKDYETFGPLSISLNRTSPDGSLRIWFEKVSVKFAK